MAIQLLLTLLMCLITVWNLHTMTSRFRSEMKKDKIAEHRGEPRDHSSPSPVYARRSREPSRRHRGDLPSHPGLG